MPRGDGASPSHPSRWLGPECRPWLGRVCLGAWFLLAAACGVSGQTAENLALNRPVLASGPSWGALKPGALTDGDPATFTHPLAETGTEGFYYEVDLGAVRRIQRVALRNRGDGCCPERLSRYRVEIWTDDGGSAGDRVWMARVRGDGSFSGTGGLDVITSDADPSGTATGRFVRVVNDGGAAYSPQLAEIEVYGGALPVIRVFAANDDALEPGGLTALRWETTGATGAVIEPGLGSVPAAAGSALVAPATTTTYTLTATNENGGVQATTTVAVALELAPPALTEFLAENDGGLRDEDGETSDWVELHNPNPVSLRMAGYALTDDPTRQRRWVLPDVRIPPRGFLVVFASGKNRRGPGGPLHTDFRLSAEGEYLALLDRDGTRVLGQFPADHPATARYPGMRADLAYGVGSDGRVGFLKPATPGATNGPGYAGVVADTKFSRDRGLFDLPFEVALSCATPGAVIRYTTDRSAPTATTGRVYGGPLTVTNTTVLRAAAFVDGWAPTDVDTQTYIFPSNVVASSVMRRSITTNATYRPQLAAAFRDLPIFSVVASGSVNDTTEVGASVEWIPRPGDPGEPVRAGCGIRQFGGAYTDFSKESFRLHFRSRYGTPRFRAPLFAGFDRGLAPVEEFDQLELRNGSHDMAMRGFYLSNPFTDDTLLEMGHLNPHGRFAHLFLNGTYWGVYHLRERWGADMHQSYLGGETGDYESINGNWNVGGWADPGVPYDGDGSTWERLKASRRDYLQARTWLDVPQFVDFMLMWMFGGAEDEWRCVGPAVPGDGFKFYLNDADGWFCVPQYCAAGNRTSRGSPGRQAGDGPGSLFSMLFAGAHPDYRVLLADRIQRALFYDGALTPARNLERLRRRTAELERPFLLESARWGYLTPAEWTARRDSVVGSWLPQRTATVLGQFRSAGFYPSLAAPVLNRQGGVVPAGFEVRFNGPASATIHYTLDGSDPRLPGGAVSPRARSFVPSGVGGGVQTPLPAGWTWRWFTDATGLGSSAVVAGAAGWAATNWKHSDFDDRAWAEGPAQLGYGEGDEATVIPFGSASAKWITAYFRRTVVLTNVQAVTRAVVRLKCDDGAIVYVNGAEAARVSMPAGPVGGTTLASSAGDDGQGFAEIGFDPALLRAGTNMIAVELHQSSGTTSDASFDLEMSVERPVTGGAVAFPVMGNTLLRARAYQGNQWSALNEAFFRTDTEPVAPGELVIREMLTSPAGTNGTEYVELQNVSARAIDLRGVRLVEGIRHAFPDDREVPLVAGGRVLLVGDVQRFRYRHGREIAVAGRFEGNLNDAGDTLRCVNAAGTEVFVFSYGATAPWPVSGTTNPHALVLARPDLGMGHAEAWRPSAAPDGTPGGDDLVPFVGEAGTDADGDGMPALIEYALGTSDTEPAGGRDSVRAGLSEDGWLTLTVTRRLGADDAVLTVEASEDLVTWSKAVRRSAVAVPGQLGRGVEEWGVPAAGKRVVFLRLAGRLQARQPGHFTLE